MGTWCGEGRAIEEIREYKRSDGEMRKTGRGSKGSGKMNTEGGKNKITVRMSKRSWES